MINANAKIPALQAQMQWIAGQPQLTKESTARMMYDFNNSNNTLVTETGFLPGVDEVNSAKQEATICDPETGNFVLFFDGNYIYDGLTNKVNPDNKLDTLFGSSLTSLIVPSSEYAVPTYYVFYVDDKTKHINYGIVNFPAGLQSAANWVGINSLDIENGKGTPLGLACRNENECWVLALSNVDTLVAYKCDETGVNTTAPVHIMLQPFTSLIGQVDCSNSSIVTFGDNIAITVNNNIMVGKFDFTSGFAIPTSTQALVSKSTTTLAPDFNASGTRLYYLEKWDLRNRNQVWIYELGSGASYSADASYKYNNQYKTLKLAPNGIVYGIDEFTTATTTAPILSIEEIPETGSVTVSEPVIKDLNSSHTFGNIQYQINTF